MSKKNNKEELCPVCLGSGEVQCSDCGGTGDWNKTGYCSECQGSGKERCSNCGAHGWVEIR